MPNVFSNDMTAHVWASRAQAEGRNSNGTLFFEGPTLFSYGRHYAAGFVLPMPDGGRVYMVNGDSYSVTTSRHVSRAAQAAPGRALSVPGLTDWAVTLWAGLARYDWGAAEAEEATGDRPAWLPCGYVLKTAAERRAFLPELRACMARHGFPGEEAAAAMFRAFNDPAPEKAAAVQAAKAAKREELAAAKRDKDKRDALARAARHDAQKSPRDIARGISERLGRYTTGTRGIEELAAWGRAINAEAKEAKARGWTRMAATLRAHYKAIRAAVADGDRRAAAAFRNRNRRQAIQRYRDAARNVTRLMAGGVTADGTAQGRARWHNELAAACAGLSRHVTLSESTLARLAEIQDAARLKAAEAEEEARAAAFAEEEEARRDWLAGGRVFRRLSDPRGGALLRAVDVERDDSGAITGGELQTSHGAAVPLTHALRVFRFLKHCRATGQSWQANGRALRVGHFRVDSVAPSGDFVAGCHRINWPEVERLAAALGVEELAPEDTTAPATAAA